MPKIQLKLKKSSFVPGLYPYIFDYSQRWQFWVGSAGSGKSFTIAQKIIIRCCQERLRVLVCRRYATTLRHSVVQQIRDVLTKWKLTPYVKIRETDFTITFPSGAEILFCGLDDEEKLLSLTDISMVWVEEAFQVEKNKIEQLDLRMRGRAANQQLILSWNPISKQSWLYKFSVEEPPESSVYIHSTYKGNPFLSEEYIAAIEAMKERNPARYRIYGNGEWGVDTEGLVITNFKVEEFDEMELASKGLERRSGMDIGWVDPSAIVDSLYDRENKVIYVFNEFYKSGCQLEELAAAIKGMNLTKVKLYVDAAEPRTIQYFRSQGINAIGCAKGKDSVKAGLMFLQDHLIIVHPRCVKLIENLENFCYIKSKITGEYTEETDHSQSHGIDGLRYAYSDIYTNTKLKTLNKSILSL